MTLEAFRDYDTVSFIQQLLQPDLSFIPPIIRPTFAKPAWEPVVQKRYEMLTMYDIRRTSDGRIISIPRVRPKDITVHLTAVLDYPPTAYVGTLTSDRYGGNMGEQSGALHWLAQLAAQGIAVPVADPYALCHLPNALFVEQHLLCGGKDKDGGRIELTTMQDDRYLVSEFAHRRCIDRYFA